jgi:amino acid permease
MGRTTRLGYIIAIALIFLLSAYVFWRHSSNNSRVHMMSMFVIMVSLVFFCYWRLYHFYRLEKIRTLHNRKDILDYFNNTDFISMGLKHVIVPLPILKKLKTAKENEMRRRINISTIMIYLLVGLYIILEIEIGE